MFFVNFWLIQIQNCSGQIKKMKDGTSFQLKKKLLLLAKYIPLTVKCFLSSRYFEIHFMWGSLVIATTTGDWQGLRNNRFCNTCVFVKFRPLLSFRHIKTCNQRNLGYSFLRFSLPENNLFKYNFMLNFGVTFNLSSLIK